MLTVVDPDIGPAWRNSSTRLPFQPLKFCRRFHPRGSPRPNVPLGVSHAVIIAVPGDEARDAFVDCRTWLESQVAPGGLDLGEGFLDVAGLHVPEFLDRLSAAGLLDQLDKMHQILGPVISQVVDPMRWLGARVGGRPVEHRQDAGDDIVCPVPGVVIAVHVAADDVVEAGQDLVIIESMKTEQVVKSPRAGTVQRVSVQEGDRVDRGMRLVVLVPIVEG